MCKTGRAGVSDWTDEGLEVASEARILNEGREVGRIVGDRLHVNYIGHGGDIVCDPDKTTTLLGKWKALQVVGLVILLILNYQNQVNITDSEDIIEALNNNFEKIFVVIE